ncbi:MAG: hypothetical protein KC713_09615, partial [Candidatus Omnitrophica bacterium]|nr:hypothetical protein [Candidatus Omnitrophota bacterium]
YLQFQKSERSNKYLTQERYSRMIAEEKIEKLTKDVDGLKSEVTKFENKLNATEKLLDQTKIINKDLKQRLDAAMEKEKTLETKIRQLEAAAAQRVLESTAGES